jgi:hypothetical protein
MIGAAAHPRWTAIIAALFIGSAAAAAAQFIEQSPFGFDRGQDVAPTFDGWVRNADGTFSLYFGYLNRNAAEELHIPIGPDNTVEPGGDRGQPTYFYPAGSHEPAGLSDRDVTGRRRWWVFRVDVPRDWTERQRVTWTLRTRGKTNRAAGWLQPEYEVTTDFIRANAADGHLFARGEFDHGNRPPMSTVGGGQTVNLPGPAILTLTATDDGRPQPAARQAQGRQQPQGLRVRWITYRGPARVTFEPETAGPFEATSTKANTKATFKVPGAYRLRAIASDGQLFSTHDIDVTVSPSPSSSSSSSSGP